MKTLITIALMFLCSIGMAQTKQPSPPADTLKWVIKLNTAEMNGVLMILDSVKRVVDHSDISKEYRVPAVEKQEMVIRFFTDQLTKQNLQADKPKSPPKAETSK